MTFDAIYCVGNRGVTSCWWWMLHLNWDEKQFDLDCTHDEHERANRYRLMNERAMANAVSWMRNCSQTDYLRLTGMLNEIDGPLQDYGGWA